VAQLVADHWQWANTPQVWVRPCRLVAMFSAGVCGRVGRDQEKWFGSAGDGVLT
jgi:hypothetical protein